MEASNVLTVSEEVETALTWPDKANAIRIVDQATYDLAAAMIKEIVGLKAQAQAEFREPKQKAYETHKAICDMESRYVKPLDEARQIIRQAIGSWDSKQRRLREEAETKLREEARRQAEDERLRQAAEAQRLALDRGATAEEAESHVTEILDAPLVVNAPSPPPTYTKAQGVSTRYVWKTRVIDPKAFIKAVAEGKIPIAMITINTKKLDDLASTLGSELQYPGVEVYQDTIVAVKV